jgi:hypothetical protein
MRQYGMPRGRSGRRKELLPYGFVKKLSASKRARRMAGLGAAAALAIGLVVGVRRHALSA